MKAILQVLPLLVNKAKFLKAFKGETPKKGQNIKAFGTALFGLGGAALASNSQLPEAPESWVVLIEALITLIGAIATLIGQLQTKEEEKK